MTDLRETYTKINDIITEAEGERAKNKKTVKEFLDMLEIGSRKNFKAEAGS